MFTPLITHDSDGTALAAPVDAARRNGATYKTRTIDDLRIKDDRLRAAIEGTGHLLFDGGMGTMLQAAGMKAGALPELLNFEEPQVITDIQRQYVEAGCDVITANTFGANAHKLDGAATVADVFAAAVTCAREAVYRSICGLHFSPCLHDRYGRSNKQHSPSFNYSCSRCGFGIYDLLIKKVSL